MATFFAKVDADLHTNPKIRRAGRNAREVFLHVLRVNAGSGSTGTVDVSHIDPEYLADVLQMTVDEAKQGVERCLATLIAGKGPLLRQVGDTVEIASWDAHEWGRGDASVTERDRKQMQRARKRNAAPPEIQPELSGLSGQAATGPDTVRTSGPGEEKRGEVISPTHSRDRVAALAAELLTSVRQVGAELAHELKVTFQRSNPMDVERLAVVAVAGWVADGGETVARDRVAQLIAFRRRRAQAERHLKFWVETTWWNADGIAKDLAQPMDLAARGSQPGRSRGSGGTNGSGAIGRAPPAADHSSVEPIDPKDI